MSFRITHYEGAAVDFLLKLSLLDKAKLKHAVKEDLIYYNLTFGQQIRNEYDMWNNPALILSTGKRHPDDASIVILKKVWEYLQAEDDPDLADPPTPMSMQERLSFKKAIAYYEQTLGKKITIDF